MRTKLFLLVTALVLAALAVFLFTEGPATTADYREAEYLIEGEHVTLDGATRYFGNELRTDLDGDGREDVAFIVTHSPGGSGTFYYAVAAVARDEGYVGSDGYLLGDRIAPQSTDMSPNPRHQRVVVFNYADRAANEPMSVQPSVAKSAYLKLDESLRWGVVEADFEGEVR